jgi:hypothetical protein
MSLSPNGTFDSARSVMKRSLGIQWSEESIPWAGVLLLPNLLFVINIV